MNFHLISQRIIYIILHYCSFWMILICIISAKISWQLFKSSNEQSKHAGDAYLTWWTTTIWGGTAIVFFLIRHLFS